MRGDYKGHPKEAQRLLTITEVEQPFDPVLFIFLNYGRISSTRYDT
jgi:hypothetical protein